MKILTVVIIVGLAATVIALIAGIVSMSGGGQSDRTNSVKFMFARVGLQAITLVCLVIALWLLA